MSPSTSSDTDVIKALHSAFHQQRNAFLINPTPTLAERLALIAKIPPMLIGHRQAIRDALKQDFGVHPDGQTDLIEVMGPVGRAAFVMAQLEDWMKPSERYVDHQFFGQGAKAYVATRGERSRWQHYSLVHFINVHKTESADDDTIPCRNFPFELSIGPLIEMLAAGNRVIMKPSDLTPACAQVLEKMISATFEPDIVTVVSGGLDLAKAFSTLQWDHLLYTGSPAIGKSVMAEAAKNLVPVTLELGGKCPAILTPGSLDEKAVEAILGTKMVKNGQMCSTVDTLHIPKSDVNVFVEMATKYMSKLNAYSQSPDCTGIIAKRHFDRLVTLLNQVRQEGAEIIPLEPNTSQPDPEHRRFPLTLVIDPSEKSGLMQEEVFGPILPIRTYELNDARGVESVIEYINSHERPLGLYVFGSNDYLNRHVLTMTRSGGACINTCAIQGALPSLGFGGIGQSGFGRHHGREGFMEFSNARGVFERAPKGEDLLSMFYPPYSQAVELAEQAIQAVTAAPK